MADNPNPIDVYVGNRVRVRRRALGMSQDKLAEGLGLTFQQVQKYERGSNRVSASKLYEIAKALQVPVGYFFEGFDDFQPGSDGAEVWGRLSDLIQTAKGVEVAEIYVRLNAEQREAVVRMLRVMDPHHDLPIGDLAEVDIPPAEPFHA